ncbi:uncharacterized protein BP5553_02524 [Venustampulla echinocandica]|uniref:Uncharacterized protein n=1 Tax=Venustampulla echinocandica TaxID=2656787 RepID=A0A370U440_9HELO|nr:uncharacterized protein BP5553_02524 [Venustampulla echinocandica]RDL42545.1 hypothetical protein BP5553_02524 [Venustampulla echinocandica]
MSIYISIMLFSQRSLLQGNFLLFFLNKSFFMQLQTLRLILPTTNTDGIFTNNTRTSAPLSTGPAVILPTINTAGIFTNSTAISSISKTIESSTLTSIHDGPNSGPSASTGTQSSSFNSTTTGLSSSKLGVTTLTTSSLANNTGVAFSLLVSIGVLAFPTSASSSSTTSGTSTIPFTFTGTWSASPTTIPVPSIWFTVPTASIPAPTATSEAVALGALFLALHANRQWVTDVKLRSQYIENIKKTKDKTLALFNSLDVKPPSAPDCSSTTRKRNVIPEEKLNSLLRNRGLLSGIINVAKDVVHRVAKLVSCSINVIDNLIDAVDGKIPPISVIETLTEGLAEIGKELKKGDSDESTETESKPSSTRQSSTTSSSSSSSCYGSTAVQICTKTVSLATSFLSGGTSSYTVTTITTTLCTTTTIAGCTGAGTTAATTTATAHPACTAFKAPTDDETEEDGVEVDADPKRRSIAGRIKLDLEPRKSTNGTPVSFGVCLVPEEFKIIFPGHPKPTQVFTKDTSPPAPTDLPLLNGVARYYDRDVDCDGITKLQKRSKAELTNDPKANVAKGLNIKDYSTDHIFELKLLLQFFKTITPTVSGGAFTVFKDCDNFNEIFFPSPCNKVMQTLYNQVPTNTNAAAGRQIEFAIMLRALNDMKGVLLKPGEFVQPRWLQKNLRVEDVSSYIVTLQNVAIAMAICKDPDVIPLFDKTNLRIYNTFEGIDRLIEAKGITLKDSTFKFTIAYETWMKDFLAK